MLSATIDSPNVESKSYKGHLVQSQPYLREYLRGRINSHADAADVLQEINKVALEKEDDYNPKHEGRRPADAEGEMPPELISFRRWIFGIARMQVLRYFQKGKRLRLVYTGEFCNFEFAGGEKFIYSETSLCATEPSPFKNLIKKEQKEEMSNSLDKSIEILSNRERQVFNLLRLGHRQVEISKILNILPCHVSAYKIKGMKKMKNAKA